MAEVIITPRKNGPYRVEGPIKLIDPDGNVFAVHEPVIFLCRCGQSANKPFCDGTHRKIGFQADTRAPAPEGEAAAP